MNVTTERKQTPRQILAAMLRRKEYQGCTGQVSSHGCGVVSIQIFAPRDDPRFQGCELNAQGTRIVTDVTL